MNMVAILLIGLVLIGACLVVRHALKRAGAKIDTILLEESPEEVDDTPVTQDVKPPSTS